MANQTIPQKPIDWLAYDEHVAQGGTDTAFAQSIGLTANNFAQHKRRYRLRQQPTIVDVPLETVDLTRNGNLPAIPSSQSIATPSQHIAMASQPIATELDDLKSRVATLEAFMAVVQSEHRSVSQPIAISSQPIAVHRNEPPTWVSRGVQLASDMLQAIDTYATQHRLAKREALDELLRIAFAQVAEEGRGDD